MSISYSNSSTKNLFTVDNQHPDHHIDNDELLTHLDDVETNASAIKEVDLGDH